MASEIDIVNRALQRLGAQRIQSLDQDHPNARSAAAAYPLVRDRLLRSYPWGFAIRRVLLPALSERTTFGGLYRYPLPSDFLRLLPPEGTNKRDWRIEGPEIVTADGPPLAVRYIARVTDATQFDAAFAEALSALLAVELAYEINQSIGVVQLAQAAYAQAITEAKRVGAFETPPQEFPEDDWIVAML